MAEPLPIESLEDPRLEPYRGMKERDLARNGDRFIAEGQNVVRRLLASTIRVESLLVAHRKLAVILPLVPQGVPVFAAPDAVIEQVIGFEFHSGVLAVGVRPRDVTLERVIRDDRPRITLAACQEISNTDNLGAIIRVAAALGTGAILLGERCCDPFFRQSVRVSMGTVFHLPIVRSENLIADLSLLRERWGFESVATVLAPDAEPLHRARRKPRLAVLFGNEAQGLDAKTAAACDRRVTIPMDLGTDSLNVAVAAGIFLYHFREEMNAKP